MLSYVISPRKHSKIHSIRSLATEPTEPNSEVPKQVSDGDICSDNCSLPKLPPLLRTGSPPMLGGSLSFFFGVFYREESSCDPWPRLTLALLCSAPQSPSPCPSPADPPPPPPPFTPWGSWLYWPELSLGLGSAQSQS